MVLPRCSVIPISNSYRLRLWGRGWLEAEVKGTEIGCLGAGGMEGERPGSTTGRTATRLLGQEGDGEGGSWSSWSLRRWPGKQAELARHRRKPFAQCFSQPSCRRGKRHFVYTHKPSPGWKAGQTSCKAGLLGFLQTPNHQPGDKHR